MPSGRQRGRILALARPVVVCLFVLFVLNWQQHQQQQYQKKKGEVVVVHTTTKNNEKQQHRVERTLAFVHLGKTAGSTLTCMIGPSLKGSGKGNSRCEPSDYRPSALADSIAARFHLAPAPPIAEYHDFLVTLRHPVARIVSWFYFLHPQFPPEKRPHHIQGCDGYHALYRCYDSISALGEGRLGAAIVSDTESNTDHDSNHQQDPSLSCKALAKDMITGRKKCWQNYYNYEYTYGELVRDDFQEQQQPPSQSPPKNETSSSDHRHPQHKNNNNNNKKKTNVTIYAIRTEHLEVDWNVIDALLGGSGQPSEGVSAPRKNSWGNHAATAAAAATAAIPVAAHDKALSVRATAYLCHLLCDEIQLYKKLLHAAVNIDARREDESLDELLQTCPEEHREVRKCRKQ